MYNKAILIGRLVGDPELKTTPNGVSTTTVRIAVDRTYQTNGERKADFINIVCWRQAAEFVCRYFAKGKAIGVDGSIQTREYTDKDGNRRTAFEVVADRVFFVESKSAGTASAEPKDDTPPAGWAQLPNGQWQPPKQSPAPSIDLGDENDDDLPF